MKILILTNNIPGLICFRKEVLESFIQKGHKVFVSAPESDRAHELIAIGANVIATRIDRRGTNPLKDFNIFIAYVKQLRKINPDVVLTYTIKPNIYGGIACWLLGVPQIANITGLGGALENNGGLLKRISIILYRIGLSKARTIFLQNKTNLAFCVSNNIVKSERTKLLPGSGVNLQRFTYKDYPAGSVIKFLYIGRLMKEKGTDELLYVAKRISEKYSNIEFHIVGSYEDNYRQIVEQYVKKGIIYYHGEQQDVRPFIEKCSCVIHPSYHEGMSNVILEGSASGRPIITTKVSGCQEAVDEGISGLLANPCDRDDLLCKVENFISLSSESRSRMGLAARSKVEKLFNRNIVIQAYNEEIENIILPS